MTLMSDVSLVRNSGSTSFWSALNRVSYHLLFYGHRYHFFYGESLRVECPTGSGHLMTLEEVSVFLARRLVSLFLPGPDGARPCHGTSVMLRGVHLTYMHTDGIREVIGKYIRRFCV